MAEQKDQATVSPEQARRKALQKGEQTLSRNDFGKDDKAWKAYQDALRGADSLAGGNADLKKSIVKSLHSGSSQYGKFLPGGPAPRKAAARSKIPQLNQLNDLCAKAHKKFGEVAGDWPEVQAVQSFLDNIDYEGKEVAFTSYFSGLNAAKKYIKENFDEVE